MNITNLILLAAGGYFLYEWLSGGFGASASTPAPAAPAAPPAGESGSAVAYQPPTLTQQLITAAGGVPTIALDADQWAYYYNSLPGKTPIPGNTFTALFFPSGRPASGALPTMSAAQFVAAIASAGLSGLGDNYMYLPGFGR